MNRQQIYDAFDNLRPDQTTKDRMLQNILSSSDSQPAGKDVSMKKYNRRRPLLVAAMVAMMLLLVGCAAAVVMNLNSLTIKEESYVENAHYERDGSKVPATEKTRNVVSLQGIQGSKNQKAAREWYEYTQSYEPNYEKIYEDYRPPEEYSAYNVYNEEMLQKLMEVCEKYDLLPAGKEVLIQYYQSDIFYETLGLESLLNDNKAEV